MPLAIIQADITKLKVDAIVNAANSALAMGGGVCGAIFRAAGREQLAQECAKLGGCRTGQAVITAGYGLPAKYIIHTVGPVWRGGGYGEKELLAKCYHSSLALAQAKGLASIAFPLLAAGIYGYPKDQARAIASNAIVSFLAQSDLQVYLVFLDRKEFVLSEDVLTPLTTFIRQYRTPKCTLPPPRIQCEVEEKTAYSAVSMGLAAVVGSLDATFAETLFRLIDAKGLTDAAVYKRANIDRRLFSKIRSSNSYMPSKRTAIALAIALELDLAETVDLIERAGYTLSNSQIFDAIIKYYISLENYNIFAINEALFAFDQPLLGG